MVGRVAEDNEDEEEGEDQTLFGPEEEAPEELMEAPVTPTPLRTCTDNGRTPVRATPGARQTPSSGMPPPDMEVITPLCSILRIKTIPPPTHQSLSCRI